MDATESVGSIFAASFHGNLPASREGEEWGDGWGGEGEEEGGWRGEEGEG